MRALPIALLSLLAVSASCAPAAPEADVAQADAAATAPAGEVTPWTWTDEQVRSAVEVVRVGRDLTPSA